MNEQLNQLLKESTFDIMGVDVIDHEMFAQLIIKQCTNVIEGGKFLHDQAPTALFAKECSSAIKQHFAVAERAEREQ